MKRRNTDWVDPEADAGGRVKEEFLAVLGHELRNPLAPIVTAVHMLREKGVGSEEVDVIERQTAHMARLVDDLLDVSRITRGKITLRKRVFDVCDVVARAIESTSPLIESRRHPIQVDIDDELRLEADPDRIAQVLSNLLTNASKYSDPGTRIHVGAHRDANGVRFTVTDEGVGIPPEIGDKVFDMFVQDSQSSERSRGGLGLGLAIVRNLVAMHGGNVRFESPVDGVPGTRFTVDLPGTAAVATPEVEPSSPRPSTPTGDKRKVLVVDDNEDSAVLLSGALRRHGFDVRFAFDGVEALRVAQEFVPDIAVLDIGLPVMDGHELAARLRRDVSGAIRFVALTGYAQASDRARSRQAGFQHHMVKPVDVNELVSVLRELSSPVSA